MTGTATDLTRSILSIFLKNNCVKSEFLLAKRQPSKKAWMVNVDGFVRFIPKSFPHEVIENYKLIVELPEWFELK